MLLDKITRDLIAAELANAANEVCIEHKNTLTREPPLTARIGGALDKRLSDHEVNGWKIKVVTQDVPDRGPGALESKLGADLYVGISVSDGKETISKGFLVQAKWADDLSGQARLKRQCEDMLRKTTAATVWFYGDDGITFLPAARVKSRTDRAKFKGRPIHQQFERVLKCVEGDRDIGLPPGPEPRPALGAMLERLGAESAVAVQITKAPDL